jgi:hypothetical protein
MESIARLGASFHHVVYDRKL